MKNKNDVVLVIRTVISKKLYNLARAEGYSREDMKDLIRESGIDELSATVAGNEDFEGDFDHELGEEE